MQDKKNKKEELKMIPLIIYPMAYFIYMFLASGIVYLIDFIPEKVQTFILTAIIVLYNLLVLILAIHNSIVTAKGRYTAYEAAKSNLRVKTEHIAGYVINFCIGFIGYIIGERGRAFIILMLLVSVACIILSGINSIGCSIRMKKDGILSTCGAIFAGIGCFIFFIDVIIAIVYSVKSKKMEMY